MKLDDSENKKRSELNFTDEESDVENRSNQSYKAFDNGINKSSLKLTNEIFEEFKKGSPEITEFTKDCIDVYQYDPHEPIKFLLKA